MIRMSVEEYQDYLNKKNRTAKSVVTRTAQNKYRNKKVYCYEDGMVSEQKDLTGHGAIIQKYDSIKEYQRHQELLMLERTGRISNLSTQKTLVIADGFQDKDGKKHRPITYKADFFYNEEGQDVVEDVKAQDRSGKYRTTETFRLKWKLLQAKYPDYVFRLY